MKRYKIDVDSVGEDVYVVMSKGHHDPQEFMKAVRDAGYNWPLGNPTHRWMRTIPAPKDSGFTCLYVDAKPGTRGAFPATYSEESGVDGMYDDEVNREFLKSLGVVARDLNEGAV